MRACSGQARTHPLQISEANPAVGQRMDLMNTHPKRSAYMRKIYSHHSSSLTVTIPGLLRQRRTHTSWMYPDSSHFRHPTHAIIPQSITATLTWQLSEVACELYRSSTK